MKPEVCLPGTLTTKNAGVGTKPECVFLEHWQHWTLTLGSHPKVFFRNTDNKKRWRWDEARGLFARNTDNNSSSSNNNNKNKTAGIWIKPDSCLPGTLTEQKALTLGSSLKVFFRNTTNKKRWHWDQTWMFFCLRNTSNKERWRWDQAWMCFSGTPATKNADVGIKPEGVFQEHQQQRTLTLGSSLKVFFRNTDNKKCWRCDQAWKLFARNTDNK